jgi:hypothetical protein
VRHAGVVKTFSRQTRIVANREMRMKSRLVVSIAVLLWFTRAEGAVGVSQADGKPTAAKQGIFLRMDLGMDEREKQQHRTNPMVDGIILMCRWRQLEPRKGHFTFKELETEIQQCRQAGKSVVVAVMPYGQSLDKRGQTPSGAHYVMETPPWLYEQRDVPMLEFVGGGGAIGKKVAVPEVWKEGFVQSHMEPLVAALARALDGDPNVSYIRIGLGHIGHVTAQASPDGSKVFLQAGWTARKWSDYCLNVAAVYRKYFKRTPLMLTAEKRLLAHKQRQHYVAEEAVLLEEMARRGVSIIHLGLVRELKGMLPLYSDLAGVVPYARNGKIQLGIGDDWPMWVPVSRRTQKATLGHDEQFLRETLRFAFGGLDGLPPLPTTILYLQPPEVLVADPQNHRTDELGYNAEVHEILKQLRQHLSRNAEMLSKP